MQELKWNARRDRQARPHVQAAAQAAHDSITATGQNCKVIIFDFRALKAWYAIYLFKTSPERLSMHNCNASLPTPIHARARSMGPSLQASHGSSLFPFQVTSLQPFSQLYRVGVRAVGGLSRKVAMSCPPTGRMRSRRRL